MVIELMLCKGCWRVVDQFNFSKCVGCGSQKYMAVGPSKWNIFRWFLSDPKHVIQLIVQDIKGKCHE